MKLLNILPIFATILSVLSCSESPSAPTTSKTAVDSCSLGLCHYNETFAFNFRVYMNDGTPLQKTDSIRIKFQYRRYDGTPVSKDVIYAYSEISPTFSDVFSVTKTYSAQMQVNAITFACFNNKYGIRDTVIIGGARADNATPGTIWVPGVIYNQTSAASIILDSISMIKNGIKFDTLRDSLIMGDSIRFSAAYRVSHGEYKASLSYSNDVSGSLKTKVFDTIISSKNGGVIKAIGLIKWNSSSYIGPRTYFLSINSSQTVPYNNYTFSIQFGTYTSKLIPVQATTLKFNKYGNVDSQVTVSLSAYSMSPVLITQGEYNRIRNPAKYIPNSLDNMYAKATWFDAVKFCNQKSAAEGLTPAYDTNTYKLDLTKNGYHLPTSAQWENALRAGASTTYWWGDNMDASKLGTEFLGTSGFNKWGFSDLCKGEIVADEANIKFNHLTLNPFAQFEITSASSIATAIVVHRTTDLNVQSTQNANLLNHFRIARQIF